MHNLAKNDLFEEGSSTILFEPKELINFQVAWDWQKEWQNKLFLDQTMSQAIWILEHFNCYTLGRSSTTDNLHFDIENPPFELFKIDRGGEVTHHLPGQLVIYLVLDLQRYKPDLNWYLRQLESVLIDVLDGLGLSGYRVNGMTGGWCNNQKVGSIGISCRRWITQHGMSLNVDCDLSGFENIIPCGLKNHSTGCLSKWIPGLKMDDVRLLMKKYLAKRFGLLWTY